MSTIPAIVNPLAFLEVDEPRAGLLGETVTQDHILKFATNPGDQRDIEALIERYKRISVEEPRLFAAPAEARLLERMIWPLRQAKANFMLGHSLATLSLCGMVVEMSAILTFDIGHVMLNGQR